MWRSIWKTRSGASLLEYSITLGLISAVGIGTISSISNELQDNFTNGAALLFSAANGIETSCHHPDRLGTIGDAGTRCAGMYIVSELELRQASFQGDATFAIDTPYGEYTFRDDANNIYTGQVTDMSYLFASPDYATQGYASYNEDIGYWDTSAVVDMSRMFLFNSGFNQNIGAWDTSSVTDMTAMFSRAQAFNQNIGNWDVSRVSEMKHLFASATSFNQDISSWNTSRVINMRNMFDGATQFDQNLDSWDVGIVRDMQLMFRNATNFDRPIGSWNTHSVNNMENMFNGAASFNQNIAAWNTSAVLSMNGMFADAALFNQDLSGWNVSSVATYSNFVNSGSNSSFLSNADYQPSF